MGTGVALGTLAALVFLALVLALRTSLRRYGWLDTGLWRWAYARYLDSETWQDLSAERKKFDEWTCQKCGWHRPYNYRRADDGTWTYLPDSELHAHHKQYHGWVWYAVAPVLGLREALGNLETRCRECHLAEHFKPV